MPSKSHIFPILLLLLIGCSPSIPIVENDPRVINKAELNMEFPNSLLYTLQGYDHILEDHETRLLINDESNATLKVTEELIILNDKGVDRGSLQLYYDSFRKIKEISGALYNLKGELIRELSESDIIDFPASSSFSLYEDNRVKEVSLYYNQFPYAIKFEYEIELNGLLSLPAWYPQKLNEYVANARLYVETPDSIQINIKQQNIATGDYQNIVRGNSEIHTWDITELDPIQYERFSNPRKYDIPHVLLAANDFSIDSYAGSFASWKDFGKWYRELNSERQELNEETQYEIDSLLQGTKSMEAKARVIYKYLQDNTRYISVQLGIGGWQTFPASFVEEKGYGDCKALTNFTFSIFEYAGIQAYPVLIKNGIPNIPVIDDFPSQQFNHVVLVVPDGDEYIWLECTSQILPFGYISLSNADRFGLMITEEGGKLIRTPVFNEGANKRVSTTNIEITEDGIATIDVLNTSKGIYYEELLYAFDAKSQPEHESWLRSSYPINIYELSELNVLSYEKKEYPGKHSYQLSSNSLVSKAGDRLFIPVNKLNRWSLTLNEREERKQEIDLRYAFTEVDSITINIPEGYYVEAVPDDKLVETDFGRFNLKIVPETQKGVIYITRELQLSREKLRSDEYNELKNFFDAVTNSDSQEIVINKKS